MGVPIPRGTYKVLAERLSRRIRAGDYHLNPLPAERELANEVGVSHMTARKAVQHLMEQGLLCRLENGRLAVQRNDELGNRVGTQVALLLPACESAAVRAWEVGIAQIADKSKFTLRTVYYGHWDDPQIFNTFDRFDGVFFIPVPEKRPDFFLDRFLSDQRRHVVVLDEDWTEYGVPSLRMHPPTIVHGLLDHLATLGHDVIDLFNVQPTNPIITAWIGQWRLWLAARGLRGRLLDHPVPSYGETIIAAYEVIARQIADGTFTSKALACTTETAATGAIRALGDAGIRVGVDVAVGTVTAGPRAEYGTPSITSLQAPDPRPYLSVCLDWMLAGKDAPWHGPLMVQPESIELVVRESTVPDIAKQHVPARARALSASSTTTRGTG